MPQPDSCCIVGNFCWAKSTAVSDDCHKNFRVEAQKIWLKSTVLEVLSVRSTLLYAWWRFAPRYCKELKLRLPKDKGYGWPFNIYFPNFIEDSLKQF